MARDPQNPCAGFAIKALGFFVFLVYFRIEAALS